MRTRIGVAILLLLAASACDKPQPSPMAEMPTPTEARVRAAAQSAERDEDRWVVRDSILSAAGLDSLLALVGASGPWRIADDEPRIGHLGIALRKDGALVGSLRVGDGWLLAFTYYSMDLKPRLRTLSTAELASVHRWIGATLSGDEHDDQWQETAGEVGRDERVTSWTPAWGVAQHSSTPLPDSALRSNIN